MTGVRPGLSSAVFRHSYTLPNVWACCFGPAMERIHRSPFATKDVGERSPVAADRYLKDTGRHPEDTEMAIPCVRSHEILEVTIVSRRFRLASTP